MRNSSSPLIPLLHRMEERVINSKIPHSPDPMEETVINSKTLHSPHPMEERIINSEMTRSLHPMEVSIFGPFSLAHSDGRGPG